MSEEKDRFEDDAIVVYSGNGVQNISLEQFPDIIQKSLQRMEELDRQYSRVERSNQNAKKMVANAKENASNAKSVAISLANKSDDLKEKSAGLFHKKDTIEAIRDNSVELAKSQKGLAEAIINVTDTQDSFVKAQTDTMEALKVSFEYDKEIADITKYLFLLGCSSIAASQTMSRTLEMKLRDASEEELSELARAELQSVVNNLKAQENMMQRQKQIEEDMDIYIDVLNQNRNAISEHEKKLKNQALEIQKRIDKEKELSVKLDKQHNRLNIGDKRDNEQDKRIDAGDKKDNEQDKRIDAGDKKDNEQDKRLDAGDKKDNEQDKRLDASNRKDDEQDKRIAAGDRKDDEQDKRIAAGDKRDDEQDKRLDDVDKRDNEQDERITLLREEIEKNAKEIAQLKKMLSMYQCENADSVEKINANIQLLATKKHTMWVSVIGIIALIVGIVNFFI